MSPHINLSRAIGAEFVGRKFKSIVLIVGIIFVLALALVIRLVTLSAWWWLLAVPVISFVIIGCAVLLLARVIINVLRPALSKSQAGGVRDFVDKLERVADNIGTPMFMIVFQVIRDVVRPRDPTFVQTVARDSTTLHSDFLALQKKFNAAY